MRGCLAPLAFALLALGCGATRLSDAEYRKLFDALELETGVKGWT